MLRNLFEDHAIDLTRCSFDRLEIDRAPPSRMIATISALILMSDIHEQITLVLGRDALTLDKNGQPTFMRWYAWDQYPALCSFKIYPRDGEELPIDDMIQALEQLQEKGLHITLVFKSEAEKNQYADALHTSIDFDESHCVVEAIPTMEGSATAIRAFYRAGHAGVPDGMTEANDTLIRSHGLFNATPKPNHVPRIDT